MDSETRILKLTKQLDSVLAGKSKIGKRNAPLFLEAVYSQPEPVTCVQRLISSTSGLPSLQTAIFSDFTVSFFNDHVSKLISYLSAPELKDIGGGDYIQRAVRAISDPPVFWQPFTDAFRAGKLSEAGQLSFAWLLLQLVALPGDDADPHRELAQEAGVVSSLIESTSSEARAIGHQLKHLIETRGLGAAVDVEIGPGGRHDNDHVDFRKIVILPTADEITSKQPAFLRTAAEVEDVPADQRIATHLDNQYRLYREDMLHELRDELQIALGQKKGRHRGLVVDGLQLVDMHGVALDKGQRGRNDKWGVIMRCPKDYDFWFFKKDKPRNRANYLMEDRNKRHIRDMSIAALVVDGVVVAFPIIRRIEARLANKPPEFVLQLGGQQATVDALCSFRRARNIKLILIDTAVFSYEPVLKALKQITHFPLAHDIVLWEPGSDSEVPNLTACTHQIVEAIKRDPSQNLQSLLGLAKPVVLDGAQASALLSGLTRNISIIQGPPGTGKSFIGALLTRALHDSTTDNILVCCYTNHALDQFLEDLLDIGIPQNSIVRLGGKSTPRTEPLSLYNQRQTSVFRLGRSDWAEIDLYRKASSDALSRLTKAFNSPELQHRTVSHKRILAHLEFDDPDFFEALSLPISQTDDGMQQVGSGGKAVAEDYLIKRWLQGKDAGMFGRSDNVRQNAHVWKLSRDARQKRYQEWQDTVFRERVTELYEHGSVFDEYQVKLERKFAESEGMTLASKRIVGCTTTAAAKYTEFLRRASPGIVVVEEAGEILESHVLTALGKRTQRLILIGDHKQLRPKVDNYQLTVEKGEGYDLNRSLFERLVLKGYKHDTLGKQHRMRPEISSYVRRLTYPNLEDAPGTLNRPHLRGMRDDIVFINHAHPEDENDKLQELREEGAKASKQNSFEVEMVLNILRYLGQQGYGTDKIVILTPYLGQLHRLQEVLRKDNDPILNDLDSFDLVRAGLLSEGAAKIAKKPIRLATIDNYQGEESDIVIVSLVRSNPNNDIGFMFAPERLNVLLSRARDAFIMIGNSDTFSKSRKGRDLWTRLFTMLKEDGHIYDGLPVKCERHPSRTTLLKKPEQFGLECPDGGCKEPCSAVLSCGHACPSKCHQISDHSKMKCERILEDTCIAGHRRTWKCHEAPPVTCTQCERAAKLAEEKRKRDFEKQQKREEEQREYARKLAKIDEEIEAEREAQAEHERERMRSETLRQRQHDRDALIARRQKGEAQSTSSPAAAPSSADLLVQPSAPIIPSTQRSSSPSAPPPPPKDDIDEPLTGTPSCVPSDIPSEPAPPPSPSEAEWQRQKDMEGVDNPSIDAIMEMTGLEDVKAQVLRIKAKIDVTQRQGTSVKDERFNIVLLGNPGTGKTTVARHYAKFLTSVDVLPGSEFFETTGSRLANDGVPAIKKRLEAILEAGGGAVFIDEAYQLVGENNFGGSQVLDFLLAEMENNIGKLVFILAGYNKQMESFFEHNPGLNSRVPYQLKFADYTDSELLSMLEKLINKKYKGRMKVEGGMRGLYARVAVRRLGRGRGHDGFGNARALHITFAAISERQATRLTEERKKGSIPDDFLLTKEDLIGPDPSKAVLKSKAWERLMALTGLQSIKQAIQTQFDLIAENYRRELREKEPIQMSLNGVFLGNPGTGKTTVAKLYGQVLAELGLLSNGEVVLKNPADFIGSVLGESEAKTKAILAASIGKVLVIDEAYMLYSASGSGSKTADPYKTAVIDTIVAEVQSVPGEDRCVIMCGYETQMREMFQNVNPGLSRRFRIEDPFHFEDFTDPELLEILNLKLKQQNLDASQEAKAVAIDVLSRARNRPNFGNGGEVENMLGLAKGRAQTRRSALPLAQRADDIVFQPADFDPEFERVANSGNNLKRLFADVVGCEKIVEKLEEYQNIARVTRSRGKDVREARHLIPTNFVFKGPPGTGKTTTARKMGQVYFDMGFLSSTDVVECSASDLVGEYVGQTGPKTRELFQKARGKVLFIDEAYRLSEGHFAKEAMDELVGILTQDEFAGRLVVILAGYDQEMNQLMAVNTGLSSRFPDEIYFEHLTPESCLRILQHELEKEQITCAEISSPSSEVYEWMVGLLQEISALPSWGNARDVKTLAKQMIRVVYKRATESASSDTVNMVLSGIDAAECMARMLAERESRASNVPRPTVTIPSNLPMQHPTPPRLAPPPTTTAHATSTRMAPPSEQVAPEEAAESTTGRDPGVSNAVWAQLQADKKAAEEARARQEAAIQALAQEKLKAEEALQAAQKRFEELARRAKAKADDETKRLLEQQRLEKIRAAAEAETRRLALEAERQRQIEEKRKEARAQEKLRTMGVCPVGYRWIKQGDGYRCAGGSHWVSSAQLGI